MLRRPRGRSHRPVHLAVAAPLLCSLALASGGPTGGPLPAPAPGALATMPSVGGLPPGGARPADGAATPTRYGDCRPRARREPGLQGQVPLEAQLDGSSRKGYRCGLRLVGSNDVRARGANFQLAWYRDCAYVASVGVREHQGPPDELDGIAVIDASRPARPRLARIVRSPVGRSQHEALEVNARRGMLVAAVGGLAARWIEVYDVSQDCRSPVLLSRYDAGVPLFHGLRVADDGRTVYASETTGAATAGAGVLHAIDVTDKRAPHLLLRWDPAQEEPPRSYGVHDLELSRDGRRAYVGAVPPSAATGAALAGPPSNTGPTVAVLDVSEVQDRRPEPDVEVLGEVGLPNFGHAVQRARIDGRPLLFASGETPSAGRRSCPWAWGDVLDLSDETRPRPVAEIRLEVNDPDRCETTGRDGAVYSIHYVGVDDERDTTMVFYTYYTGGLRVFDVRDPERPVEIAYYHPPPLPDTVHEPFGAPAPPAGDGQTPAWDSATSVVRYRPGARRLWFVSVARGFQILQLRTPASLAAAVRLPRQRRAAVLADRTVRVRVRCSEACLGRVRVGFAGRLAGERRLRLRRAGRRLVPVRLAGRALADLRRYPGRRLSAVLTVHAPGDRASQRRLRAARRLG